MGGDYTRLTFDPRDNHAGVLMQQGRVQLDADWNELVEVLDRRWRAETIDIIGRCTVPRETPDGFRIEVSGGSLTIGRGRIYVHGLLTENHGKEPLEVDAGLGERRGTRPVPYAEQPYLPNPPQLPAGGPHLVYLDVWQREVTWLEEPDLVEKAVGVDTATRLQTVWQVRVHEDVGEAVTCATPEDQIPGWQDLTRPSAGRLTTAAVGVPSSDDPCVISPNGGYRGKENQLYRVEIHQGGPQGTASFKWSRDNGSVATAVTAINAARDQLTVLRTGRDPVLRFAPGQWVEVTDDRREFAGQPGEMRKVQGVDEVRQVITLSADLPSGAFDASDPSRHTRVRRWDQMDPVRDPNGNIVANLDASDGVIPVPAPATPASAIILEDGVQITFTTDPPDGVFRAGDYWVFAARTADASVEPLQQALPRGTRHHYCRLAVVTFPDTASDCRVLWPPDAPGAGCDCTVCVTAESHNTGTLTIQRAIDQVKDTGGKVCLGPGVYHLGETPVQLTGAKSVHLAGQGWKTMLLKSGAGPALVIDGSLGVTVEDLALLLAPVTRTGAPSPLGMGVALRNCLGVTLQRCIVLQIRGRLGGGPAIGMDGYLFQTTVRENALIAATGIANVPERQERRAPYLLTAGLHVQDNLLWCWQRGIAFDRFSLHFAETRLRGNAVTGCPEGGIVAVGAVLPGSRLNVEGNQLRADGDGIVVGTDGARVSGNDISAGAAGKGGDGIVLAPGLDPSGLDRCQVLANRVTGVAGHGIALRATLRSAMIKHNVIQGVGGGAIVMDARSSADGLTIENNQLLDIAPLSNDRKKSVVGIRLLNSNRAEVVGNTLVRVGRAAVQSPSRAGIQVIASSSVRIAGNEVGEIGPAQEFVKESAGVEVVGPFDQVDVVDNVIRRSQHAPGAVGASNWYALRITIPARRETVDDDIEILFGESSIFGFFHHSVVRLPRRREVVAVRGNLMEAYGDVPVVQIGGGKALVFSDNRCVLASRGAPPVTVMAGRALIASANYVEGPGNAVAMRMQVPRGRFTVLGNIATGPIEVNGTALAAPWAPLNAIAP